MPSKRNAQRDTDFPVEMSEPAWRALSEAGYTRLAQLTRLSESDLLRMHGVGPKTIVQLRAALAANGLSFAEEKTPNPTRIKENNA